MIEKEKQTTEIVARIASPLRTWDVLSWAGDTMQLSGEYSLFDSDIGNAIRFGIRLVECFDPSFARKWEKTREKIEERRSGALATQEVSGGD